jgi:hypothetical protein
LRFEVITAIGYTTEAGGSFEMLAETYESTVSQPVKNILNKDIR